MGSYPQLSEINPERGSAAPRWGVLADDGWNRFEGPNIRHSWVG